jgi:hypothetical protein
MLYNVNRIFSSLYLTFIIFPKVLVGIIRNARDRSFKVVFIGFIGAVNL